MRICGENQARAGLLVAVGVGADGDGDAELAARRELPRAVREHAERRAGLLQAPAERAPRRRRARHPPQRLRAPAAALAWPRPGRVRAHQERTARYQRAHRVPARHLRRRCRSGTPCADDVRSQCHRGRHEEEERPQDGNGVGPRSAGRHCTVRRQRNDACDQVGEAEPVCIGGGGQQGWWRI